MGGPCTRQASLRAPRGRREGRTGRRRPSARRRLGMSPSTSAHAGQRGLEDRQAERLVARRRREDRGLREPAGHVGRRQPAEAPERREGDGAPVWCTRVARRIDRPGKPRGHGRQRLEVLRRVPRAPGAQHERPLLPRSRSSATSRPFGITRPPRHARSAPRAPSASLGTGPRRRPLARRPARHGTTIGVPLGRRRLPADGSNHEHTQEWPTTTVGAGQGRAPCA